MTKIKEIFKKLLEEEDRKDNGDESFDPQKPKGFMEVKLAMIYAILNNRSVIVLTESCSMGSVNASDILGVVSGLSKLKGELKKQFEDRQEGERPMKKIESMFDDIPETEQGLILFKNYGEKQIKVLNNDIKRMGKLLAECERRLDVIKRSKGAENGQAVSN
jgi:hypothetical protein